MTMIGNKSVFKVIEPDGSVKEVFEDGSIAGFPAGSIVFNHYPALLTEAVWSLALTEDDSA